MLSGEVKGKNIDGTYQKYHLTQHFASASLQFLELMWIAREHSPHHNLIALLRDWKEKKVLMTK